MSSSTSSLLRTKNSTKLVKRFLQRTSEYHAPASDNNNTNKKEDKSKKRKRQQLEESSPAAPVSQDNILQRHIQTLLGMDQTMSRPPTKALKRNKFKETNMEATMQRIEKEQKQEAKEIEKAKKTVVGNARCNFQQHAIVHEPTFDKRRYAKEKKEKSLKKIAKLLKKTQKKLEKK